MHDCYIYRILRAGKKIDSREITYITIFFLFNDYPYERKKHEISSVNSC